MSDQPLPPELRLPRWRWQVTGVLAFLGLVLGFLGIVPLGFDQQGLDWVRQNFPMILLLLLLTPLLLPLTAWLVVAGFVFARRAHHYPALHRRAQASLNDVAEARQTVVGLVQSQLGANAFEIMSVRYDRNKLYIVVKKRRTPKLDVGATLMVIDTQDQMPMGQFVVTEERSKEYYAVAVQNIDALWLGIIREQGVVDFVPNMTAIYVPPGGSP